VTLPNQDANWTWAVTQTEDIWKERGLGGEQLSYAMEPTIASASGAPTTIKDDLKKVWYNLEPLLRGDRNRRAEFLAFAQDITDKAAKTSLVTFRASLTTSEQEYGVKSLHNSTTATVQKLNTNKGADKRHRHK
jgi:hypothetical protein